MPLCSYLVKVAPIYPTNVYSCCDTIPHNTNAKIALGSFIAILGNYPTPVFVNSILRHLDPGLDGKLFVFERWLMWYQLRIV